MIRQVRGAAIRGRAAVVAVVLSITLGALALLLPPPGHALAGTITPGQSSYTTADPRSITFRIHVDSSSQLQSARVEYRVFNPDSTVGGSVQAEVNGGTSNDLAATLETRGTSRYIPVGSKITYSWTLVDRDGTEVKTPSREFIFLDGRYQWSERTQGNVTVYWYGNNERLAVQALAAVSQSISDNEALLKVTLPYPVRVMVWPRESEGELAQQPRGASFDSQVVTGGSRVSADVLHIYDSLTDFVNVARHEAAHLVTKVAGDGTFTRLPSWLDEGTAVYAQTSPGQGYEQGLRDAVQRDTVLRLRSMQAPSNRPDLVNGFYGQSWATVKFMIDTYGRDKFAELFRQAKGGKRIDDALKQVYGVDQDGLYNAWRQSVGLKPIDFPPGSDASSDPSAQGTRAPLGIPTSVAGGQRTDGDGTEENAGGSSANTAVAVAVGGVTVLVAGGLGFAAMRLRRKRPA